MTGANAFVKTILVSTLLLAGRPPAQEWRPFEMVTVADGVYAFIDHLDLYFIDVEGGAATLIVTPAGESVLIDAGWGGFDGRDAKRIRQAMRQAGITAIDHLVVTHYHMDHYGGVPELAGIVPIKRFYDHGKMTSLTDDPQFAERYGAYQAAAKG